MTNYNSAFQVFKFKKIWEKNNLPKKSLKKIPRENVKTRKKSPKKIFLKNKKFSEKKNLGEI